MKKFLALIVSFIYLFSANAALALNELYYINNAKRDELAPKVEALLLDKDYTIKKKNPFWAVSNKNSENYAVIILEPTGQNLYYYIEANKKGKSLNKAFLKMLEEQNISYQEYYGDLYMSHFSQMAQKAMTGEQKTYSFEQPKQMSYQQAQVSKTQVPSNALTGFVASIGAGSVLDVYLQNAINTATANVGDSVVAVLKSDWVVDGQHVIAPQGSVIYGNLTKAVSARYGMRNGGVVIDFNKIVTPDGKSYDLVTQPIDFDVTNDGKLKSTASKVAVAGAVGALTGLLFSLIGGGDNYASGAAIGAGVAGGIALVSSVAQKGVDAEIPSFTELEIVVEQNINVIFNY